MAGVVVVTVGIAVVAAHLQRSSDVQFADHAPASRLKDQAQQYQAAVVAMVTAVESIFWTDDHSTG